MTGQPADRPEPVIARVKVPVGQGIPRLLRVRGKRHFVPLEDVMAQNLDVLFPGLTITSVELFRVTRNANTERDEEDADDLLELIESDVLERRFAPIVRLEVQPDMDPLHRSILIGELELDEAEDVFEVGGILAPRDLMELVALQPGDAVLDLATGRGAVLLPAARRVGPSVRQPGVLAAALERAGFAEVRDFEETVELLYASPEAWWESLWAHGSRRPLERLQPEVLSRIQADCLERVQSLVEPRGVPERMTFAYVLARRPAPG